MNVRRGSSGMSMLVLSVPMAKPGILTKSSVIALLPQLGMGRLVSYVAVVESTKKHPAPPANANAPLDKPSSDQSAPSNALLASSTAKPTNNAPVPADIIGTEAIVSFASVDEPGTTGSTIVSALITKLGTDTHVITHAQVEEFWIMPMDNVSAPLVTGMVLLVSSATTIKSGPK